MVVFYYGLLIRGGCRGKTMKDLDWCGTCGAKWTGSRWKLPEFRAGWAYGPCDNCRELTKMRNAARKAKDYPPHKYIKLEPGSKKADW